MKCSSLFALVLGLLAVGLASRPVSAATSTASFAVSATVVSICQATSPPSAAYGTFGSSLTKAASSVAVTCNLPTPYSVVAHAAETPEASAFTRKSAGAGYGSSHSHFLEAHSEDQPDRSPRPHSEAIIVTVTY